MFMVQLFQLTCMLKIFHSVYEKKSSLQPAGNVYQGIFYFSFNVFIFTNTLKVKKLKFREHRLRILPNVPLQLVLEVNLVYKPLPSCSVALGETIFKMCVFLN